MERRGSHREPMVKEVGYSFEGEGLYKPQQKLFAMMTDVSDYGCGILTPYPINEGQVLVITKGLPFHAAVHAEVRWVLRLEEGYKAGLHFIAVPEVQVQSGPE